MTEDERIARALAFIRSREARGLSLEALAEACGVNEHAAMQNPVPATTLVASRRKLTIISEPLDSCSNNADEITRTKVQSAQP